jgi:RNA polymerase sigma-70 factor (ECF subfamily)
MPHDHERETLPNGLPPGTNADKSISLHISPSGAGQDRLEIFHQHRRRLLSIAYRMLGTVSDAEDMLQETFIRWQQSSDVKIESPEAFLVTIISRLCLNYLQSARVKREEYFGQWLPEPVVTEPAGDPYLTSQMDGEVSMAFLVLLERLTPLERAAFLLREAFEYEYGEIARILEQTEANCRQLFRRARQHLKEERPRFEPSPKQREELLERFLQASLRGEMDGLLALFSKEIVLYADGGGKATAVPNPIYGVENVIRFLVGARRKVLPADLDRQVRKINGAPGVLSYWQGRPHSVLTLDIADGRIRKIFIVSNPDKLTRLPILPSQSLVRP